MLKAQTTPDLIAADLRNEIISGRILPGAALRQEELAARFAVSRIPVREALRRLESDGLVSVFPNRGAFVVRLSAADITEITDMRILIEGDLIARAVRNLGDADLQRIAAAAAEAERAAPTPGWVEMDRRFHQSLYRPAGRPRQLALALSLRREVERYDAIYQQLPAERERWLHDHVGLLEACRAGDPVQARSRLADHIARAGAFLVRCVKAAETAQGA